MVELLRHRQTKGAATDMFYLTPPRHISTLPEATVWQRADDFRSTPVNGHRAVGSAGPFRADSVEKVFWGDERNFLGPLMPFARGDVRDHIVSHKTDQGASYGRYAVLQWWSRLKINFCESFGVVQFVAAYFVTVCCGACQLPAASVPDVRFCVFMSSRPKLAHSSGNYCPRLLPDEHGQTTPSP
jgi:hypothetical protein